MLNNQTKVFLTVVTYVPLGSKLLSTYVPVSSASSGYPLGIVERGLKTSRSTMHCAVLVRENEAGWGKKLSARHKHTKKYS